MTALLTGLVSLLVFGVVILVHELGHFWAARHCGIHVEEFSIGFGPRLWQKQYGNTQYSIRLLPLGGYNLFAALPEDADETDKNAATENPVVPTPVNKRPLFPMQTKELQFEEASAWRRFMVTASGAAMNFVLGFVVLVVLVLSTGRMGSTTVSQFTDHAKSAAAGLSVGDRIVSVDGNFCRTSQSLATCFDGTEKTHTLTVLRSGELITLPDVTISPTLDDAGNLLSVIDFRVAALPTTPHNVAVRAGELFRYYGSVILGGFWQLATGQAGMEDLSGPIGTAATIGQAMQYGWRDVLSLVALLTINIGIFNLLPIPALDGCKLLFLLFEAISGRAVPQRAQAAINMAGTVLLLWLMILVTMQDVIRFF